MRAKVLSEHLNAQSNLFENMGQSDGEISLQNPNIENTAEQFASIMRGVARGLPGQCLSLPSRAFRKEDVRAYRQDAYNSCKTYHQRLTEFYRANPRAFSKALSVIYLLFAVLLTFADIPLALKLTQWGFGLDMGTPNISELLVYPFLVIQQKLGSVCIGIRSCPVQ